jgi:ASC-1-like (ASCH) protein
MAQETPNVRNLRIYQEYYNMIVGGGKAVEIRVGYKGIRRIQVGDVIRFNNQLVSDRRVVRVTEYASFAEMMAAEDPSKINPHATAEQQLKAIRRIFPPEKEKLGVFAIELAPLEK